VKLELSKPQADFLKSPAPIALLIGGRGLGKTHGLASFLLKSMSDNPLGLGLIGAQNPSGLHGVLLPAITQMLRNLHIEYCFGDEPPWYQSRFESHVNVLSVANGFQAVCRSMHDSGADRNLRGLELATIILDEVREMEENTFDILLACLRSKHEPRRMRLATTPNGHDWIWRKFVENPLAGSQYFKGTTMTNKWLPQDYSTMLQSSFSRELYAQEVLGEFVNLASGLAFQFGLKNVDQNIHFNPLLPLLVSIDLNVQPMGGVVAQVHDKTIHVFDEIYIHNNAQTRNALRWARDKYPEARECWHMVDEAGAARSTRTIETDVTLATEEARRLWPMSKSLNGTHKPRVRDRINALNALLDPAVGPVRLKIHPRCKQTMLDLESLQWDESGTKLDKCDSTRSHWADALNYLTWRMFPPGCEGRAFGLDSELQEPVQKRPQHSGFPAPIGAA
jgi:hypothetical protein